MNLKSRKTIFTISGIIIGIIFVGIFSLNFFHEDATFLESIKTACIFSIPLAVISLPSGLLMMNTSDARDAMEEKRQDKYRTIYENGLSPFLKHNIDNDGNN